MQFETPADTYKAYQKFLKKEDYKKAYHCLEKMLLEFPGDIDLLKEMVDLCLADWEKPDLARKWLIELTNHRTAGLDYLLLSRVEASLYNITNAKEYLKKSKEIYKRLSSGKPKQEDKNRFYDTEQLIKYKEWDAIVKSENEIQRHADKIKKSPTTPIASVKGKNDLRKSEDSKIASNVTSQKETVKAAEPQKTAVNIPLYNIPVKADTLNTGSLSSINGTGTGHDFSPLKETLLFIDYMYLTVQKGFDELLCLNAMNGIEKYWYQIETVKKVLKSFHGRVLLSDEVGLGKTIEAGMLIKEYLLRGMIKNVLILTPSSLVSQWREEMSVKFGIEFVTTDSPDFKNEFKNDPATLWKQRFIIASINTAKSSKNMPAVIEQFYDLVVVDEAHHLRNRTTMSWKLVNQIKKRFIFLLTATPVQNNLIELFNLITLLKPGQFKTEKKFKEEYLQKGNLKTTANREKLRELLRDVMIRNTRSAIDLKLPKRFATTLRLEPTDIEREIYSGVTNYLKKHDIKKSMTNLLLRELGSSPYALRDTLLKMDFDDTEAARIKKIIHAITNIGNFSKGNALIGILLKNPDEKKIIFAQFIKSMDYIASLLRQHKIPHVIFSGDMTLTEKDASIAKFRNEIPVLISTESGGEGRNMQFCNTIINFDLPWNPMRIEQRIGRLHRIGQNRDVFIFNLTVKETIEDYIIEILDSKINMFEMVIGEIEPILGQLGEDRDFEDIVMEIWLNSKDEGSIREGFEQLGNDMVKAKSEYTNAKLLDNEIFGEDYET
ncbi:MAG: SNF2-related protein [Nitrospira sp.]|nr:SNF2-related protein [Nitrospira sp.]